MTAGRMVLKPRKVLRHTYQWELLFLLLVGSHLLAWGNPSLPHLISDHAVFQQGRQIHIWGTARAGEPITISLARAKAVTRAGANGHWGVDLPAMAAGGPFTLTVTGKTTMVVKDVLIGEVWVASGQSNMVFELAGSAGAPEELPKADYPEIHLFTIPKRIGLAERADTLSAAWAPCTPESAKQFSAVAYYFARKLHRELHVPIGIIESAWPGTVIEEWMAPQATQTDPAVKPLFDRWNSTEGKGFVRSRQPFDLQFDNFELMSEHGAATELSNFDDGTAGDVFGGYWYYDLKAAPETAFGLSAPGYLDRGFAAHVGGRIDASDDSRLWLRFHQDLTPVDLSSYDAIRFWVRGHGMFRFRSLQSTITDWDDYSADLLQASADWKPITIKFRDLHQEGWGVTQEFTPQSLTGISIECLPDTGYPVRPATGLHQGMIAPLVPYAFRGVIWYQGESNAPSAHAYQTLLPDLIKSWRTESHQPDMQFIIVQLPNHGAIPREPTESAWAELREAQLMTARNLHDVGLAVTIDLGDPADVHPHRKAEVGERLALWALGKTYNKQVVYSGPLYESMSVNGNAVRVQFSNIGSGLVAKGGDLQGFEIAGADRKFHWANASIEGNSVVVSSPGVPEPVAVRYGWGDSPQCNLYNVEGLPASPFRTDRWPGITETK